MEINLDQLLRNEDGSPVEDADAILADLASMASVRLGKSLTKVLTKAIEQATRYNEDHPDAGDLQSRIGGRKALRQVIGLGQAALDMREQLKEGPS